MMDVCRDISIGWPAKCDRDERACPRLTPASPSIPFIFFSPVYTCACTGRQLTHHPRVIDPSYYMRTARRRRRQIRNRYGVPCDPRAYARRTLDRPGFRRRVRFAWNTCVYTMYIYIRAPRVLQEDDAPSSTGGEKKKKRKFFSPYFEYALCCSIVYARGIYRVPTRMKTYRL